MTKKKTRDKRASGNRSPRRVVVVRGGEEPEIWRARSAGPDVAPSGAWAGAASARVAAYDADFEMYVAGPQGPRAGAGRRHTRAQGTERTRADPPRMEETRVASETQNLEKLREAPSDDGDDDDDDELKKSPLLTYPGFEPVTMYDEDDLDPASIFVLLAPRGLGLAKGGPEDASARRLCGSGGGGWRRRRAGVRRPRRRDVRGAVCRARRERERVRGVLGLRGGTGVK